MKVFYRIYPGKPDNRPFANGNKRLLVQTCLWSFLQSCRRAGADVQLTILLDGCPDDWASMAHYIAFDIKHNIVMLDGIGNKPSFLKQLEMTLDGPGDEFVYFAEDDYLYRPCAIKQLLGVYHPNFNGFYSSYDHIDRYVRGDDRKLDAGIIIAGDWHWRTAESTTMAFGAPRHVIRKTVDIMREYACEGRKMWYPIIDKGYILWSPIPSLATHVQDGVLAPCVDWETVWAQCSHG
jgi:hypothetical protein